MATTAQQVIDLAQIVLVDATAAHWPETELLEWVNAGVRAVVAVRADASNVTDDLTLVAGTKQTLPAGARALLDITRNTGGRAVRQTKMALLDAQRPTWHTDTAGPTRNYCYDPRTPRIFYVYPPAVADAQVEAKYDAVPVAVTAGQNLPIGDEYVNVVLDYVLYRAFSKDAEVAGTGALADRHKQAFDAGLGVMTAADAASRPTETAEA